MSLLNDFFLGLYDYQKYPHQFIESIKKGGCI